MGIKLNWTGLFLVIASHFLFSIPAVEIVGAILFLIGIILMWLDK